MSDLAKAVASVDLAGKACAAEVVKASTPVVMPILMWWVFATCPNHPKSYTDEEKQ